MYSGVVFDDSSYAMAASTRTKAHASTTDSRTLLFNTHFNTASHTMDNVPEGGTYGKASFTRLGYSDRAGAAIDSGNLLNAGVIVRGRTFTDGLYATRASLSSGADLHTSVVDSRGFGLNTHFNTVNHTMDNVPEGGTYGKSSFTRLGYADRAGGTIDASNLVIAGHIVRARTLDDGLYMLRSGSTDGRILTANDPYFSDTSAYVSTAYQRGIHSLDNVVDGASYLKVFGVAAGLITQFSSARRLSCSLYQTVATGVPNNTWSNVGFNNEDFDPDNLHDNTTNNHLVSLPNQTLNGVFLVIGTVEWGANGVGYREAKITRHGASDTDWGSTRTTTFSNSGLGQIQLVVAILQASGLDTIRMQVFQNSGGLVNTVAAGTRMAVIHLW